MRIEAEGEAKTIRILRIHLEEDAGKSKHPERAGERESRIDLNRCGTPLIEIVSEPDLRSPGEAYAYLSALKQILEYTGVCDGNMEEGSLRCDANVSVRPRGQAKLGTRTELKNLNSFRFVEKAITYEILRQIGVLEAGGAIVQETLLWEPSLGKTRTMRGKEDAHDYRYFPDPDLPPLVVSAQWIDEVRSSLPELPDAKRARLAKSYGLPEGDLDVLVNFPATASYFEEVVAAGCDPKATANWVIMELLGQLNKRGLAIDASPVSPTEMIALVRRVSEGRLSGKLGKMALEERLETGEPLEAIVTRHGWEVVADDGALRGLVEQVLAANAEKVAEYRGGKEQMFRWFVGQVMKLSKGQAEPRKTEELLRAELGEPGA